MNPKGKSYNVVGMLVGILMGIVGGVTIGQQCFSGPLWVLLFAGIGAILGADYGISSTRRNEIFFGMLLGLLGCAALGLLMSVLGIPSGFTEPPAPIPYLTPLLGERFGWLLGWTIRYAIGGAALGMMVGLWGYLDSWYAKLVKRLDNRTEKEE